MLESLSRLIARGPVPPLLERVYMPLSQEGPMAVLPLEGSVIVGRTVGAQQRSGFIEAQERLTEEVAVAVIWLFGVRMMQHLFDKAVRPRVFPNYSHLRSDTAWDVFGRLAKKSIDLLPSERETLNAAERKILRRIQAARLGFSTAIATLLAALVIPVLNTKKTEWLMKRSKMQARPNSNAILNPTPVPARVWQRPSVQQPLQWVAPARPAMPVRFGKSLGKVVQPLGHLVDQTAYGTLLVIDLMLTLGRVFVYGKRSPVEGLEIIFRDVVSVYFYLFATPHVVRLMAGLFDRVLKSNSLLTPPVAELLRREMLTRTAKLSPGVERQIYQLGRKISQREHGQDILLHHAIADRDVVGVLDAANRIPVLQTELNQLRIDAKTLRRVIHGHQDDMLAAAEGRLKLLMQQADRPAFENRLRQTLAAYGVPDTEAGFAQVMGRMNGSDKIHVTDIQRVLKEVRGQENLATAIKLAFRDVVGERLGLDVAGVERYLRTNLQIDLSTLSSPEREALIRRIQTAGHRDGLDGAASMLRRQMNRARGTGGAEQQGLVKALEPLSGWVEASAIRGASLQDQLADEVAILRKQIRRLQPRLLNVPPEVIESALQGNGLSLTFLNEAFQNISGRRWRHLLDWLTHRETLENRLSRFQAVLYPEAGLSESLATRVQAVRGKTPFQRAEQKLLALSERLPEGRAIEFLLSGQEGRLFSLATPEGAEKLTQKVSGIVRNGLTADSQLLTDALLIRNQIPLASHVFGKPKNAQRLQKQISRWLTKLQWYVSGGAGQASLGLGDFVGRTGQFTRLGRNLHYPIWILATGFSIWGLGVFVPKMQMVLTYILTGRFEHPGLKIKKPATPLP